MRNKVTTLYALTFIFTFIVISPSVTADQIDEMVTNLTKKLVDGNISGFSELAGEYFGYDPRMPESGANQVTAHLKSSLTQMEQAGTVLSDSVIKKQVCGDRLAQVIWVAFTENGHVGMVYWFFNVTGRWSLANLTFEMQGSATTFLEELDPHMTPSC